MNPQKALETFKQRGIAIEARGPDLHVRAPRGVVQPEDVLFLKQFKPELLEHLRSLEKRAKSAKTDDFTVKEVTSGDVQRGLPLRGDDRGA